MKELKKIKLIESPRKDISLEDEGMSSVLGGESFYCPGTYKDGGIFGHDYCSVNYSSEGGACSGANDYCRSYKSCTFKYS